MNAGVGRLICLPYLWLISSLLFLLPGGVQSQDWQVELDSILRVLSDHGLFNGQIVLSANGDIQFEGAYGKFQNKGITSNTSLPIASIEKTITAAALILLEQKGSIQFNDLISAYLPDIPYEKVTIRHLLNQTSGIPNFLSTAIELVIHLCSCLPRIS